ncbi:endonuclease III [Vaginisenegalia massiliensis]|uniref:endonuclease III n=1 Tax=Vaginisenegalia massiliensis TaxID=2058294 RepID=UPI000F51C4DE|nr:endonuclease III [Vaginisenegalia massiliensis]
MLSKKQTQGAVAQMSALFPDAACELIHDNAYQLLIAVMLSAQTTDAAVNKVTPKLFERFPDPYAVIHANPTEIEPYIKTIGLYRNKARFIYLCCQELVSKYQGQVPQSHKELTSLAGVGRKTANVVQSVAFGIPAIAVDTHVERVAKRLHICCQKDTPLQVEITLQDKLPQADWSKAHHTMIFFGRYFCTARNPQCQECPLLNICAFGQKRIEKEK